MGRVQDGGEFVKDLILVHFHLNRGFLLKSEVFKVFSLSVHRLGMGHYNPNFKREIGF